MFGKFTAAEEALCARLEEAIQLDVGKRGIQALHIPGELGKSVKSIRETIDRAIDRGCSAHFILATGFPCVPSVDGSPMGESDGPPGIALLAWVLVTLHSCVRLTLMFDECHSSVMLSLLRDLQFNRMSKEERMRIDFLSLPLIQKDRPLCAYRECCSSMMKPEWLCDCAHWISAELSSFSSDGRFRSMGKRDISHSCGLTALMFDYAWKSEKRRCRITCIGDGGNEVGFGKVKEQVIAHIPHGESIHAATECDFMISAGVSNWGCDAIAIALSNRTDVLIPLHQRMYQVCSNLRLCDGIIRRWWPISCDGLDYIVHFRLLALLIELSFDDSLLDFVTEAQMFEFVRFGTVDFLGFEQKYLPLCSKLLRSRL